MSVHSTIDLPDYHYDVFVSYRRVRVVTRWVANILLPRLADELEFLFNRQPLVFKDDLEIQPGSRFAPKIEESLKRSKCMLAILNAGYFQSHHCVAEWDTFNGKLQHPVNTLIIPLRLQDCDGLELQWLDFSKWRHYEWDWRRLDPTESVIECRALITTLAERIVDVCTDAPPYNDTWRVTHPTEANPKPTPKIGLTRL